jgi:5'-3' exonuclease
MSFLGNDFLPHGLSLNLRNDGHTHIRTMLREIGPNLIHETHGWTLESLRRCLGWIAKKEEYLLKKALSTKRRIQFQPADGTGNELAYNEWFKTPLRVFDEIALVQKWNENDTILRKDWTQIYQSRYLENIQKRCEEEYCRGLNWIFYYYTGRPVSFEWMYPWHLPPLWCRLLEEARSWKQMPAQNPIGEFIKPQEQLALVLPQQSWWLVRDAALRALPEANPALWPTEFRLCMAGKRAMWECEAMIPLFTPARLRFLLGLSR